MTEPTTEPTDDDRELEEAAANPDAPWNQQSDETEDTSRSDADQDVDDDPETFPREYVVKLRQEAADNRVKAQRADDLAVRLHASLVAASGRLADPSDLAFSPEHLDDAEALTAAIDELVARKPHLASRKPSGDVGQGVSNSSDTVDLAGILRAGAR